MKKILLMVLAFVLAFSLASPITKTQAANQSYYLVTVGDNGTAGYALASADSSTVASPKTNYKADSSETYGHILADELNNKLGVSGAYTYYSNLGYVNATVAQANDALTNGSNSLNGLFKQEVGKATDIVVNFGVSDLLVNGAKFIGEMALNSDSKQTTYQGFTVYENTANPIIALLYSFLLEMAKGKVYTDATLKEDLLTLLDYYAPSISLNDLTALSSLTEDETLTTKATEMFKEGLQEYSTILANLKKANPNATIYVVGLYNEYKDTCTYNGKTYTMESLTEEITNKKSSLATQALLKGIKGVATTLIKDYGYQAAYLSAYSMNDTYSKTVNEFLVSECASKGYTYVDVSENQADDDLNPYLDVADHKYVADKLDDLILPKYEGHKHTVVTDKAVASTCTTTGLTEGSHCSSCNEVIKKQETVAALGHNYESKVTVEPTETKDGVRTYTCTRCNDSYTEAIAKLNHTHTVVTDKAVASTCTTTGLTEGSHCSSCNEVIKKQETVAALGHNYQSNVVAPTQTEQGYTLYTCSRCNESYKDNYTDPTGSQETELPFTDVPKGKWYYNTVKEAYELGLMTGKTETTFDPTANMTRGQVATVLYRIAGKPAVQYDGHFPDVPDGKYYSDAVTWCYQSGVVQGNKDGTFKPANNITRQELAIMLKNFAAYMNKPGKANGDLSIFADQTTISNWAKDAVAWAVGNGVIGGKTRDGKLYVDPKANATRAECAKMLLATYKMINE